MTLTRLIPSPESSDAPAARSRGAIIQSASVTMTDAGDVDREVADVIHRWQHGEVRAGYASSKQLWEAAAAETTSHRAHAQMLLLTDLIAGRNRSARATDLARDAVTAFGHRRVRRR
jgi:hypothetical protein